MAALFRAAAALGAALLAPGAKEDGGAGGARVDAALSAVEARPALEAALAWLVGTQRPDGSWGRGVQDSLLDGGYSVESYYDWQFAAHALACLALAEAPPAGGAEVARSRAEALRAGAAWLCSTRLPGRGSDWDVDYVWSALYGYACAVRLAEDPRFAAPDWQARLRSRGEELLAILLRTQTPDGGWGYYDDPPYSARPKWATSFCTALVLPALARGLELGWLEDARVLARARDAVRRCALPNGAFAYDVGILPRLAGESINDVRGSLGRTAVCLWALSCAGEPAVTPERIRAALADFFRHHRFLDVARLRPYPHEAYYANSGYFYLFGHYYAAELIERLPAGEREGWHARLRPHLVQVQSRDGSSSDFVEASYTRTAGTAYAALALSLGMPQDETP